MNAKANQIASLFLKRRRGRVPRNEASYCSQSRSVRGRKTSMDDGAAVPKRSRSRSINTQTDDRDFQNTNGGNPDRKRKHSQPVTPEAELSPKNSKKVDAAVGAQSIPNRAEM